MKCNTIIIYIIIVCMILGHTTFASPANPTTEQERLKFPHSEYDFYKMLDMLNIEKVNRKSKIVSWNTFKDKNLVVYGRPYGDMRNGEYRYLGYTVEGYEYTNSDFPADPGAVGDDPATWTFIEKSDDKPSWSKIKDNMALQNHIIKSVLEGNKAEDYNFKLSNIGDIDYIKTHFKLLSLPTADSKGSIYAKFKRSSGGERYATFYVPELPGEVKVETNISTDKDIYETTEDSIDVQVRVDATTRVSGAINSSYILKTAALFGFNDASNSIFNGTTSENSLTSTHTEIVTLYKKDYGIGEHIVKLNGNGITVATFGLGDIKDTSKEIKIIFKEGDGSSGDDNEPYIIVTGEGNPNPATLDTEGKANVNVTVSAKAFELADDEIEKWQLWIQLITGEWVKYEVNSNLDEVTNDFIAGILGDTIFSIKAIAHTKNVKTLIDEGTVKVLVMTNANTEINPDLYADPYPRLISISPSDFKNNVVKKIDADVDASKSTASEGIDKYLFSYKVEGSNCWIDGDWTSNSKIKLNDIEIRSCYADLQKKVKLVFKVAVKDSKGSIKYAFDRREVMFSLQYDPPEGPLKLPSIFYPKEVTRSNPAIENIITWSYKSPDNLEYKESIVSLYKWIGDTLIPVFENRVQDERKLNVEGTADEEYRIRTQVVDEFGNKSSVEEGDFIIQNARPVIDVTLDTSKIGENILKINVENKTPIEIESIYPTTYTNWEIIDGYGTLLERGTGKAPLSVIVDDRYSGNVATVIQYATNILRNTTYDKEHYRENSTLDFIVEPQRLYETELATVTDLSKAIENKEWLIKKETETEYKPLVLKDSKFTREKGRYHIRLEGDGRLILSQDFYQYSNDRSKMKKEPVEPTQDKIKKLYGENKDYVVQSAKWGENIEKGNFDYEGISYKYRRKVKILLIDNERIERTKQVEFLDGTPVAIFTKDGTDKMYKKNTFDGSESVNATNLELQKKYPILFDHLRTKYIIEPLTGMNGNIDYSLNKYIKGEGKEIEDGKVVFRGKKIQDMRFDKDMYYRVSYTVFNGLKNSEYAVQEYFVKPELYPNVDINIGQPIIYRDPNNQLKAKMDVVVTYSSLDDEIDLSKSKLLIFYDKNKDGNSVDSGQQWIMRDSENLESYLSIEKKVFTSNKAEFTLIVDNQYKNVFGKFKFEFEAIERSIIPNFDILGDIPPIILSNTFALDDKKKIVLIDNQKPVVTVEMQRNNTNELWIIETTDTPLNYDAILQQLNLNRMSTTIYVIKKDNTVEQIGN